MLAGLGEPVDGEDIKFTKKRNEHLKLVANAKKTIEEVNTLHDELTKHRTIPELRAIGFVLHSEIIEASTDPHSFTQDWALIQLYDEKIDWSTFKGNKVYIGTSFSISWFPSFLPPLAAFSISRLVFSFS